MTRYVIAAYVENKYGVLARVTGMFMKMHPSRMRNVPLRKRLRMAALKAIGS